jgi:DMSO/TMAO reductase YedYZ molybdopterin-dependent catalytic subunit
MTHRIRKRPILLLFVFLICATVTGGAQQSTPAVAVTGSVTQPLTLTAAELAQMPRAAVTTTSGGIERPYEGVWLYEILKKARVPLGERLRGRALTTYVLAEASDGYQVVFSIGELDPAFVDNQILLADKANGKPLFGEDGAFRIVAPREKRAARSVRMLSKLEVVQSRK